MPIPDRFVALIQRITPTSVDVQNYDRHLASVSVAIKRELRTNRVLPIGSFSRRTAVKNVSDLDLLVVLSASERKWGGDDKSSRTVLRNLRGALENAFPNTAIGIDANAVAIHFSGGRRSVEVVPAFFLGPARQYNNYPVFRIPDGNGDWLYTSPQSHQRFLKEDLLRSRGKSVRLAQLVKFWASCHPHIQLTSFHVEMLIASYGICAKPIGYAQALYEFFRLAVQRRAAALRDPIGISKPIPAAKTAASQERVLVPLGKALDHATRAMHAEYERNTPEAVRQWAIVFNHQAFSR